MGNCYNNKATYSQSLIIKQKELRLAIEQQKLQKIQYCLQNLPSHHSVDNYLIHLDNTLNLNPLGLALLKGKVRSFQYIKQHFNASMDQMDEKLEKKGNSALKIVCTEGYIDLLKYILPFYLNKTTKKQNQSISVDFSRSILAPTQNYLTYTSIHLACQKGHISILNFLVTYFKSYTEIPNQFDIHAIDEYSGQNCALIASRCGNFTMLKFLYQECKVDFQILNRRQQNCINVAVSANRKRELRSFFDCVVYLIDTVGLDVTHGYQQTLLMAENPYLINFLETRLKDKGTKITKFDLQKKYQIVRSPSPKTKEETKLETYNGRKFEIKKIMQEFGDNDSVSVVSGIVNEDRPVTPFISTIIPFNDSQLIN